MKIKNSKKITNKSKIEKQVNKAVNLLLNNKIVIFPTETVYGIGANIYSLPAIKQIFKVKKRPLFDPLIIHIGNKKQKNELISFCPPIAEKLIEKYWPGPLTIIFPKSEKIHPLITSNLNTVAIRMPKNPIALKLLKKVNVPIAAPSANFFSKTSITTYSQIKKEFKQENIFIIDGGDTKWGIESTVIKIINNNKIQILRPGVITKENLYTFLYKFNKKIKISTLKSNKSSPGHLKYHYMPKIPLIIINEDYNIDLKKIAKKIKKPLKKYYELKLSSNPINAARSLYKKLNDFKQKQSNCIIIKRKKYQKGNLWDAIWDRLNKAASFKIN